MKKTPFKISIHDGYVEYEYFVDIASSHSIDMVINKICRTLKTSHYKKKKRTRGKILGRAF